MINAMNSGFRPQYMAPEGGPAMMQIDRPDNYGGGGFGSSYSGSYGGGAPASSFTPPFAPSAPPMMNLTPSAPPMMGLTPSPPPMMGLMSPFGARNRGRRSSFSLTGFDEAQQDGPVNFMARQFGGGNGGSSASVMPPFGRYSGYNPFGGFNPYGQMF